jgi:hypothetical protein
MDVGTHRKLGQRQERSFPWIGKQLLDDLEVRLGQLTVILLDDFLKRHPGTIDTVLWLDCVREHCILQRILQITEIRNFGCRTMTRRDTVGWPTP